MLVNCPSCNKHLNVPDTAAGKKARCPGCNNVFDVPVPAAVAVMPVVAKPPPPQRDSGDQEERPRRRAPVPDDDDDLDDDRTRAPSRRRVRDDDDFESADDDVSIRRRGGSGSVAQMTDTVSGLLKIASYVVIVYFVINLVNTYITTSAAANLFRNINVRGAPNLPNINVNFGAMAPSPVTATLAALLVGGVIYGACVAFMLIGAANATHLTGRGFVMTGVIIALVLGSLGAIGAVVILVGMLSVFMTFMQPVNLLACVGASAVLLFTGIRGLAIMGNPDVKAAFAAHDGVRPGRRRARADRYDDEDDDEDDREPRRRRRARNDDED